MVNRVELADGRTVLDGVILPSVDNICGSRLARWEGQDVDLCRLMFAEGCWNFFPGACKIQSEGSQVDYLDITPAQQTVVDAYESNRWVLVNKYRQAKISTITLMLLLRDCMLLQGLQGILIGNKSATSEELFRRITFAYRAMAEDPEWKGIVAPLDPKRKALATALFFEHGGSIQLMSAEAASTGVGYSTDRLVFTEVGEVDDLEEVNTHLLPGIWKRPNARVWAESTSGKLGSEHHRLWLESLDGKTRFKAVFLEWWRDDSCWIPPGDGFSPTTEELEYLSRHEGMDFGHLAYRREAISTAYANNAARFASKHPSHDRDGWMGGDSPTFPTQRLLEYRARSKDDPEPDVTSGVGVYAAPVPGRQYVVLVDPGRFGESGDVSAITVMELWDSVEVACWEGREEPPDVADRVEAASTYFNNALIVVEENVDGVITALVDRGLGDRLFWSKRRRPGWNASSLSIQRGETRLIEMLNHEDIILHSRATIDQLIAYTPDARKRRARKSSSETRHFDRARTLVMYADIRIDLPVRRPKPVPSKAEVTERPPGVTLITFHDMLTERQVRRNPLFRTSR